MDSKKVKNSIGPFIVVSIFVMFSFWLSSSVIEVRNWQSIMLLTTVEFFAFYVIANANFNLNKARALCGILAIMVLFCSIPYVILAWATYNLNIQIIDAAFNILYSTYEPFSISISVMLIAASLSPPRIFDDFASRFRIDSYLRRINMFCGLYIFSVDPAMVK